MKCPGCDYELWNLKAGPCPECGRPFKPSKFDFLPNAVKFCCPRCTQPYYGTSENGQLVPDEFDCVSCGLHVKVDDMLLLPADALGSRAPTRAMNPWLDESRSTNRKYFSALGMSIGQPGKMLEATPAIGSVGPATTFALLNFVVAGLLTLALAVVLAFTGGGLGPMVFLSVVSLLLPAAYMLLWVVCTHGLLKLFRQSTPEGIPRTYQALAFSSGGYLLSLVPCFGFFLGFAAWSVCAPFAVKAAHGAKAWPVALATLAFPGLTVLGVVGLYASFFVGAAAAGSFSSPVPPPGWAQGSGLNPGVVAVVDELRQRVHYGAPPTHGAILLDPSAGVTHQVFAEASSPDVAIGPHTANSLEQMDRFARDSAIAAITATWPADVTAHRVGRLIFTHHGIKSGDDPQLALMVVVPSTPGGTWYTIQMSGWSSSSALPAFWTVTENTKRAAAGLAPLPDLNTMASGTGPWTAADGKAPASTGGP